VARWRCNLTKLNLFAVFDRGSTARRRRTTLGTERRALQKLGRTMKTRAGNLGLPARRRSWQTLRSWQGRRSARTRRGSEDAHERRRTGGHGDDAEQRKAETASFGKSRKSGSLGCRGRACRDMGTSATSRSLASRRSMSSEVEVEPNEDAAGGAHGQNGDADRT
jgi:hypothetical protein